MRRLAAEAQGRSPDRNCWSRSLSKLRIFAVRIFVSALALGLVGFLCGYFGPLRLNPHANAGPLLGIFLTGPSAFALGIAFGAVAAALGFPRLRFAVILSILALCTAAATLYLSLPEDRYQGFVIDAEIRSCQSPASLVDPSVRRWEKWNAETVWRVPRASWQADIPRMLQHDSGVVVSMVVHHRWDVYEQGKPWNRGRLRATSSTRVGVEDYFVRGLSCSQLTRGERVVYSPEWEASNVSPPDILPTFLGLYVLQPVPAKFRALVPRDSRFGTRSGASS